MESSFPLINHLARDRVSLPVITFDAYQLASIGILALNHLDIISVYGGGGSEGIAEEDP